VIDRILLILADNAAGLEARQLQAALGVDAFPRDDLGTLIADGRAVLDTTSGVDVYRLGAPVAVAPKPKSAPTSRMVPIALLDALALAVNVPAGTSLVDMCHSIEAERATGIANHRALQARTDAAAAVGVRWQEVSDGLLVASLPAAPPTSPTLPDGWSAVYTCDGAEVRPTTRGRWEWAVGVDGEDGSGVCADLANALAKADAVRALS
jgi:hypothetical protein